VEGLYLFTFYALPLTAILQPSVLIPISGFQLNSAIIMRQVVSPPVVTNISDPGYKMQRNISISIDKNDLDEPRGKVI